MISLIIQPVVAAILSLISPALALIFLIGISGKNLFLGHVNAGILYAVFALVITGMWFGEVIETAQMADSILAVAGTSYLFMLILARFGSYLQAVLSAAGWISVYMATKAVLFGKFYHQLIANGFETFMQIVKEGDYTQEQIQVILDFWSNFKDFFLNYYPSAWILSMIIAIYLGAVILSRRIPLMWVHKRLRMPFPLVYLLIAGLVMFLIPLTNVIGGNVLISLTGLFLIQGVAILDFYWGKMFRESRVLSFILIFAILLNSYMLGLIALMGVFDIWFDFRKITNMEEIDEGHSDD